MSDYTSPMQAIRKKRLDCTAGQSNLIKTCPVVDCPLFRFRLGLNPNTKRNIKNPLLSGVLFRNKANLSHDEMLKHVKQIEEAGG